MTYYPDRRLWALTDNGAIDFLTLRKVAIQQQQTIENLCSAVVKLQTQVRTLEAPKTRRTLGTATGVRSPYSTKVRN